jgi:serine/threonine protein kinase
MDKMNPSHLNKAELLQEAPQDTEIILNNYLVGIKRGIDHIHSLGLVHNDINPNNIMIAQADNLGFDSCLREGLPLGFTKRTFEWHDPNAQFSHPSNDSWAFKEVRTWLIGTGE